MKKSDAITKLDGASRALAEAKTFEEAKKVHDVVAAAETYLRKTHANTESQNRAAEIKLRSARLAGGYLRRLQRGQGERKDLTSCGAARSSAYAEVLERTGTSREDASRWQRIEAVAEELFEKLIAEGKEVSELTTEGLIRAIKSGKWHPMLSSGEDNWWTPHKYIEAVHEVMGGIDLDPASCAEANKTVGAKKYHDRKSNGIDKVWEGRIFLNPPYGAAGPEFIEKFLHDLGSTFNEGIILVNSRATDADWFQPLFEGILCFTDHRIDFDSPGQKLTSSTHGSCFVYFGPNREKFIRTFGQFGPVVERCRE